MPANIVLTSEKSSSYPGGYASGVFLSCGLVGSRFEQPGNREKALPTILYLTLQKIEGVASGAIVK